MLAGLRPTLSLVTIQGKTIGGNIAVDRELSKAAERRLTMNVPLTSPLIPEPPFRAGNAGHWRVGCGYGASFGIALSTNRKNGVLRAPAITLQRAALS
jgi:hypothetical protein